ncbi:EamA family transporter [Streptomyces rimosus]|uniref:EamA family transporter n=1 Tax=Streptomyces rimosus TaxID=1927 RepID=UPI001F15F812|nr:EamA family transporter [Streptomyces rimosus]
MALQRSSAGTDAGHVPAETGATAGPDPTAVRPRRPGPPAPVFVLGSVVCVQLGQALGKGLIDDVGGPWGVVALRLAIAAVVLLLWRRPRLPAARGDRLLVLAFGTSIAGMNLVYSAMAYLPLGVAVTLQLLGPLAVALGSVRRWRDALWGVLAVAGVLLLAAPGAAGSLPAAGLAYALASAAAMGSYLLLSRRAGARSHGAGPLALAVAWAAVLTVPYGLVESGAARLTGPSTLVMALGVALLSAVVPYSLEFTALRRLPVRVVGVLQSLEPVVAGLAGLLLLREWLTAVQWAAIGCIAAASAGVVATGQRPEPS